MTGLVKIISIRHITMQGLIGIDEVLKRFDTAMQPKKGYIDGITIKFSDELISRAMKPFLIKADTLKRNDEFNNCIRFINTDIEKQMKGVDGHVL